VLRDYVFRDFNAKMYLCNHCSDLLPTAPGAGLGAGPQGGLRGAEGKMAWGGGTALPGGEG